MFDAIDEILDGRDNIEPVFFVNNDVDFAVELQSSSSSFVDPSLLELNGASNSSPAPVKELKSKEKKSMKRPASRPDAGNLLDVLTKKWKEDKEERELRYLQDEEKTKREEKQSEELLGLLKIATQALSRMAED